MPDQPQAAAIGGDAQPPRPDTARTRVFLSYSRKDDAFTRRLADALEERGYTPDFDQSARDPVGVDTGIAAEDEWWQRLKDMIAAADVMVFVVSPDSAASKVCDEEIAYARALGKRIIPVLRRPVDFARVPPRLSALNVKIDFADDGAAGVRPSAPAKAGADTLVPCAAGEAAFAAALDALCAALDTDVAWHRESARLTMLAVRWKNAGRPDGSAWPRRHAPRKVPLLPTPQPPMRREGHWRLARRTPWMRQRGRPPSRPPHSLPDGAGSTRQGPKTERGRRLRVC